MRVYPMPTGFDWWDRMWDTFSGWCDAEQPQPPEGYDRSWGCYRLPGHTGRHLGLVTKGLKTDSDGWMVWG